MVVFAAFDSVLWVVAHAAGKVLKIPSKLYPNSSGQLDIWRLFIPLPEKKNHDLIQEFHKSLGEVKKQKQNSTNQPTKIPRKKTKQTKQAWRKELCIYGDVSYRSFMFACARGRNV